MSYRISAALRFQCGRGHPYQGTSENPAAWCCTCGECKPSSGVFDGPEAEMRRVRAVFDDTAAAEVSATVKGNGP